MASPDSMMTTTNILVGFLLILFSCIHIYMSFPILSTISGIKALWSFVQYFVHTNIYWEHLFMPVSSHPHHVCGCTAQNRFQFKVLQLLYYEHHRTDTTGWNPIRNERANRNFKKSNWRKMFKYVKTNLNFPKMPPKVVIYKKLIISANLFQLTCCLINLPIM